MAEKLLQICKILDLVRLIFYLNRLKVDFVDAFMEKAFNLTF
jgi:hypothetical protein